MKDLKIFADIIEDEAIEQIDTLMAQHAFKDAKVRIMPDVHAGKGCVIGFTADLGNKIIPNIVGVDIGCGMYVQELGRIDIDFQKLDRAIKQNIPSGLKVRNSTFVPFPLRTLRCFENLKNVDRLEKSMGTLGGGNHFIEIDENKNGTKFLIIHTGSRNLGLQVAKYYQDLAIKECNDHTRKVNEKQAQLIMEYRRLGKEQEIEQAIKDLKTEYYATAFNVPKELCYLEGENAEDYLHDMKICQAWASLNRKAIAEILTSKMGWKNDAHSRFEVIHNYIDEDNMVRKGAISAKVNQPILIPLNMRDGCIFGFGKGNPDWNYSAPHGAGRLLSRAAAKATLSLEDYKNEMSNIYTTSVNNATLDEAPMAYKPTETITNMIGDTVRILDIWKPIYNFKANE